MGRLLRLFIQHKAVGVADQGPIVCMEEDLVWKLCGDQGEEAGFELWFVMWDYSDTH